MLTASRSLNTSWAAAPELPRIAALTGLYQLGVRFRRQMVMMISGRSGHQKSGFALFLCTHWAMQGLRILYLSADMSSFTASTRIAGMLLDLTTEEVEFEMKQGGERAKRVLDVLANLPIVFAFDSPISGRTIDDNLNAYVEVWDEFPDLIVVDNLMDIEGCDSDYTAQMDALQKLTAIGRETGSAMLVLHHATDKNLQAINDPYSPPSRDQVKGGMSEKPELSLSVALNPHTFEYKVACIKQRMGPSDPSANMYATLRADPAKTRFAPYVPHRPGAFDS